uniref:NADH:ubiquinone reductase (H(+)-translocating) n=1 Tax=Strongyloides ratti TaxID=34506 RepID=A0A0S3M471_STRRB|nr:NADH dehydrogenase subunit 5 [Strongyloides ratti]BAT21201.1 NADH dehydrogenase subunit 5 [Strongyloides ratti]
MYFFLVFVYFCFFVFIFFLFLFFPCFKLGFFFFDWSFICLKFNFFFSSILFSFVLLIVSLSVFVYSCYYLNGEVNFYYYYFVLLVFISSMFFLIFCNSVFFMLLSWDILGISSFFLVLFYSNWDSCNGSMNTVLTNRLGDFFLFVFFSLCFFSSFYFFSFSFVCFFSSFFLVVASFTKSAQYPFSGWLPKAMSAPTPVSALVHSSTLVTAGLVLLMSFSLLSFSKFLMSFILLFGIFTMFFSSISALYEDDLKKVVALSTLSQMGFSMVTFGLGLNFICLFHLLSHALFKSCLFLQVGYMIHCSFGQQDGRSYNLGVFPFFVQVQILVTLFCLCGLFFLSGSVSKDLIIEMFYFNSGGLFFCFLFFFSVFFTFFYSYRLWKSFFLTFSSSFYFFSSSFLVNFLSLFLVFFSVFFIWWLNFNFLCIPVVFLYFDFYVPLFFVFMFFCFFFFSFKKFFFLFFNFMVDYYPVFFSGFLFNLKFFDIFLNKLNLLGFSFFNFLSLKSLFYFNNSFNSVVFLIFLFFFIF